MVHTINKGVIATIVEVIHRTSPYIIGCHVRRRGVYVVVVGTSVAMRRCYEVVAMRWMMVGVITMRGRCVVIILRVRPILMVVIIMVITIVMVRVVVISMIVARR